MIKKLSVALIAISSLFINSCETEFSLNGDYKITPIVFGLIDHTEDYHVIKITKAYLGDGDNLVYAKEPDSNYFSQIDAKIIEFVDGTESGREWTLEDTIFNHKDSTGLFYGPEQKAYGFWADDLDSSATYRLEASVENGSYSFDSETELIPQFSITGVILNPSYKIQFAKNTINDDDDYLSLSFPVNEGKWASLYNYKYTFNWTETYLDGSTASFSLTFNNGDKIQEKPEGPTSHQEVFSGYQFYTWLGENIPDDPNVEKRVMDGLDVQVSVAHYNLDQYMQVSKPVSGLAQIQPTFTNINGGLGLFSSRIIYSLKGFRLNTASVKELCTGQYTGTKMFCSPYPEDFTETYFCP